MNSVLADCVYIAHIGLYMRAFVCHYNYDCLWLKRMRPSMYRPFSCLLFLYIRINRYTFIHMYILLKMSSPSYSFRFECFFYLRFLWKKCKSHTYSNAASLLFFSLFSLLDSFICGSFNVVLKATWCIHNNIQNIIHDSSVLPFSCRYGRYICATK